MSSADHKERVQESHSGLRFERTKLTRASFLLIGLLGVGTALVALTRTDDDPIEALLSTWPAVLGAGLLYVIGMALYSVSWAALFEPTEDRRLIALAFIISQPVKYLPGGIAQPIGQIALTAQATGSSTSALVSFPIHVLVNIVVAITLGAPLLFVLDLPAWSVWLVALVPLAWAALDRRWLVGLLRLLGRVHPRFALEGDLPRQRLINAAFGFGLAAHAAMFASFGVLTSSAVPQWSWLDLAFAYGIAWLVGYVAIPAPAGLGARETVLAVMLGAELAAGAVVRLSAIHRIATLLIELSLVVVAMVSSSRILRSRQTSAHEQ